MNLWVVFLWWLFCIWTELPTSEIPRGIYKSNIQ